MDVPCSDCSRFIIEETHSNSLLKLTVFGITPPAEHVARRDAGAADAIAVDADVGCT
jgi:hypothetical protein